uniref:PB1 domain-containing protein n=1 Tax=Paramormyrops kingsleyae TaxID=1676925 RepID=A0A3B3QR02_9TELE
MAAAPPQQPMLIRVVETDRARKLKLSSRPASVDALIKIIKEQLEIDLDFSLLYEDPDFDGKLTSLADIEELPEKAVVHISLSEDSSSTASTDLLSDVSSPGRLSRWPQGPFPVPTFAFDVELKLQHGNAEYERSNRHLKLTRDLKHDILEKLASTMYSFKAYPNDKEIAKAAEALVAKHPCLKEAGSETGWNGWKNSIKFKMGNYRTKMRRAGCQEVTVNAGKRSRSNPDNEPSHSNIKRPKRAEVNFLPNFPQGKDPSSLDQLRQAIVEEVKKAEKNLPLIRKLMETTFPLRRQTIVMSCPPVKELLDLWPALKMESEIVISISFSFIQDEADELELDGVEVALFTVISDHDTTSPVHYQPVKISVVIESDAVVSLPRFGEAFLVMFGLIYTLHLSYPKALTNTLEFTQKILLGLESGKLSPRLQTLKNDLVM